MWKPGTSALKREAKEIEKQVSEDQKRQPVGLPFSCWAYRNGRPEAVSGIAKASRGDLHLDHFFCLRSFRTLRHFELNFLTLFKGLEAVALDGAIVNKDV